MASQPPVVYHLDPRDVITFVNSGWSTNSLQHGIPGLGPETVLKRCLWQFVSGDSVRALYEAVFARVRREGAAREIPFRCDTADCRVWRRLRISALAAGGLRVESRQIRCEPRPSVALFRPDSARSGQLLRMCGWCQRLAIPDWVEVETAVERLGLFSSPCLPGLSHGICEECLAALSRRPDLGVTIKEALIKAVEEHQGRRQATGMPPVHR